MDIDILRKTREINYPYTSYNSKKVENLLYGISGTFLKQNVGNFLLWESYDNFYIPIDSNLYQTNSTLFHIDPYLNSRNSSWKTFNKSRYMRIGLDNSTNKEDTGKDLFSETYYLDYKFNRWIDYVSSNITVGATISNVFSYSEVFNGENKSNSQSLYNFGKQVNNTTYSVGNRYEFIRIKSEKEFELKQTETQQMTLKLGFLYFIGIKHKINTHKQLKILFWSRS